jgi:tetratricopeptide (TPR) repeat protein
VSPSRVVLALGLLVFAAGSLSAQDVEQLYQKGVAEFNSAHMENACETLKQVESQKPGYQQVGVYSKMACSQVPKLYQLEEDNYNKGVQFFNQNKLEDAKQVFRNVVNPKVPLNHPKYRAQAQQYLTQIEARENDEQLFQEATRLLKQNKFSDARAGFSKLAQGSGPRAGDAKNMLAQVDEAERKREAAKNQPAAPPSQPSQPEAGSGDESLRAGLTAYFNGDYDHAEHSLSDYLTGQGSKQQLAHFFRGAAHSAMFFLSGEKESKEKSLALEDFRALKGPAGQFQAPTSYISPKIVAIYREAVGAQAP